MTDFIKGGKIQVNYLLWQTSPPFLFSLRIRNPIHFDIKQTPPAKYLESILIFMNF